jgi:hypothetical protein
MSICRYTKTFHLFTGYLLNITTSFSKVIKNAELEGLGLLRLIIKLRLIEMTSHTSIKVSFIKSLHEITYP